MGRYIYGKIENCGSTLTNTGHHGPKKATIGQ